MYVISIVSLMLVLPLLSAGIDAGSPTGIIAPPIIGKWFVFWAMGARLLLAGIRQILRPRYTAEAILGIRAPEAQLVVRELGFANTALGIVGLGSLIWPGSLPLAAVAGAAFYTLAGINHVMHAGRNQLQTLAMVTDLFAASMLATFAAYSMLLPSSEA